MVGTHDFEQLCGILNYDRNWALCGRYSGGVILMDFSVPQAVPHSCGHLQDCHMFISIVGHVAVVRGGFGRFGNGVFQTENYSDRLALARDEQADLDCFCS